MPKQTKTASVETPVPTPVQAETTAPKKVVKKAVPASTPAPASASAVQTAPVEPKAKKVKAPKVEEKVVAASGETEAVAPVEENADALLNELSIEFFGKIQQLTSLVSSLKADFRTLEKKYQREIKINQKKSSKRGKKAGSRAPSGFVKPTLISDELAKFLDKPTGSEMARTEVTRDINTYIRNHNLQDKGNGRKINPDTKLAALLKLTDKDELTYFNLQRYMSPHFAKNVKVEATTTA
jgi:upstream activation factor subunit UAF30